MKLECSVEKIKKALSIAERMTGKNLTLPVLNSILMEARKGHLVVKSTNLNIGGEITIDAKVDKEGVVAIRGDILNSLFSVMSNNEKVFIELIENSLLVKTKTNTVTIKTIPHEDFPTIPKVVGSEFSIPVEKFIDGIKAVSYSSSVSEIKPEIGSVYISNNDDTLVFVATDSFRLAEKKVKLKVGDSFDDLLIPVKNINEIIRIFQDVKGDISMIVDKNQLALSADGLYLTSRVVDGVFPDYKQIIPKDFSTKIVLLKQDLLNSIKISNVFADKFNQITISCNPKEKFLEIVSKNNDIGENITSVSGTLSGEEITVNFNYRYILDVFQSISSDSISLEFAGPNKPMVVRGIGDNSFMYLIMPMNR